MTEAPGRITRLLREWRDGDPRAFDFLVEEVYSELRGLAAVYLARERPGRTLQPTALVHEAYFRLLRAGADRMQDRSHFFAAAAQAMRRILVESARRARAAKRQPDPALFVETEPGRSVELLDLDRALEELERLDARHTRLIELRFFGGLTIQETAEVLSCSPATVERDWKVARVWLRRRLAHRQDSSEAG